VERYSAVREGFDLAPQVSTVPVRVCEFVDGGTRICPDGSDSINEFQSVTNSLADRRSWPFSSQRRFGRAGSILRPRRRCCSQITRRGVDRGRLDRDELDRLS
jgi:hypothetical protein